MAKHLRSVVCLLMACGSSNVGEQLDAAQPDAQEAVCIERTERCLDLTLERCLDNAFVAIQTCHNKCEPYGGCDRESINRCRVRIEQGDGVPDCEAKAPPMSFEPDTQWTWDGPNGEVNSIVTPLVANVTDDNGDGAIDLCDTPDIIVLASTSNGARFQVGHLYVLDGETGRQHFRIESPVDHTVAPALGDIDSDGLPEIVALTVDTPGALESGQGTLIAFEHDGNVKWVGEGAWVEPYAGALALADVDNDGDVEIVGANWLADHEGKILWTAPEPAGWWSATTAADLDGDGDLELVLGHAAYHHDGTEYFVNRAVTPGYPQVANLDLDPEPEVLVTGFTGITVLEHDGSIKLHNLTPTGSLVDGTNWIRPATIHDFDGDGHPEFALSSADRYAVYRTDGTIMWQAPVSDHSGIAGGTAFDFLGDGIAEAMYADESELFVFDGKGEALLRTQRSSGTLTEYPVVADVDNDGSAEIVVVSNTLFGVRSPTVQVIRDAQDRWIQARRIWNQHTYHVTNVREDGTIPQYEPPSWKSLNTFRTNAQIEDGDVCHPIVE